MTHKQFLFDDNICDCKRLTKPELNRHIKIASAKVLLLIGMYWIPKVLI